jgi:predicted nuclease of restriction endonuclease-like (RecB) superfamily
VTLEQQIAQVQQRRGWGAKVIDRLAHDLRQAFPNTKGFSPRNLKYMRAFAAAWPDGDFVQQAAAQLPWFHVCTLLDKLKGREEREWYAARALEHGWSRNILVMQIETRLLQRQGAAATNFAMRLPEPSAADRTLTEALKSALSLVDARVLDHIIVAGTDTLSFAERA